MDSGVGSALQRASMATSNALAVPLVSDKGLPERNAPAPAVPGYSAALQGPDRFLRRNFAIQRDQFTLPLPGTANTLGKSIQG